jgi:glycosyltransferase involved in cell wall biosynthesis
MSGECRVFAEDSHFSAVMKESERELGSCAIRHISISVAHTSRRRFIREAAGVINLARLFLAIRRDKPEFIFIFSASPIMKCVLARIASFAKTVCIIVCHGELEGLSDKGMRLFYRQNWWTEKLLRSVGGHTYLVIPSTFVYHNMMQYVPEARRAHVISFEHPLIFGTTSMNAPIPFSGSSFSSAGVASLAKSSQLIFGLAERVKVLCAERDIRFRLIGRVENGVAAYANDLVDFRRDGSLLSFAEFADAVRSSDYLLYFYSDELYRLIPSGALLDALLYEKPVIAFDNAIMRNFFRVYGPVGVLCADNEEMAVAVARLAEDREVHAEYVREIRKTKASLTIAAQSEQFVKLLTETCGIRAGGDR